jgi:short-subunit dehydrogenase
MKGKLKRIEDQVIVLTGASSGIGLATARLAAERGARLVLAARSEGALSQLVDEIRHKGGQAIGVITDVSDPVDVRKLAEAALAEFGTFDTWINNAGVGMYGPTEQVDIDDMRRLFDTNFWGLVYGSLEAVKYLKERGGTLINVGSTTSERAVALQGVYSASKHAVKGFTDALRVELEHDGAPVQVTLIKPGAIDTPFTLNAKNYLSDEPKHVPPVYSPTPVASAILHCAETPVREVFVGAGGKGIAALGQWWPWLADRMMSGVVIPGTYSGKSPQPRGRSALDRPSERLAERGDYPGHVARSSIYTVASLHPVMTGAAILGAGLALGALMRPARKRRSRW